MDATDDLVDELMEDQIEDLEENAFMVVDGELAKIHCGTPTATSV